MALSTFAAIDIGTSQLSMKIYEVSRQHGIKELSHVRHKLFLGAETYSRGFISYQTVSEICTVLNDFQRIMADFNTKNWQVYATSGLREAKNCLVVVDQIKIQTGFDVKVQGNSEACFLYYKALALKEDRFETYIEEGTLVVNIGAGSVQLSIFNQGKLCATQNLLLGSSRIQELLHVMQDEAYDFNALISEYMERDLNLFQKYYLDSVSIHHIITIGGMIPEICHYLQQSDPDFDGQISKKLLMKKKLPRELAGDMAKLIIPTILLCRKLADLTDCSQFYLSAIDFCDSIVADYAQKKLKLSSHHDFTLDILSAAENIAKKYKVDMNHVENVQTLALEIFDRIRKLHGLGRRERLLLQIGVILHSCGSYINEVQPRECSYRIIMSTDIIGISNRERAMVANMVRYNTTSIPTYEELDEDFNENEYITIVKLNAILKTANVLDKSNRQKIRNVGVTLKDGVLTITADTMADITLEKGLFHHGGDVFQEVFGIRPVLRQKRSGH